MLLTLKNREISSYDAVEGTADEHHRVQLPVLVENEDK